MLAAKKQTMAREDDQFLDLYDIQTGVADALDPLHLRVRHASGDERETNELDNLARVEKALETLVPDHKLVHKVLFKQTNEDLLARSNQEKLREVNKYIDRVDQRRNQKQLPLFIKKRMQDDERLKKKEEKARKEKLQELLKKK